MATTDNGKDYRTSQGEDYFIHPDHRNGNWRSQWAITPVREVEIFEQASAKAWGSPAVRWGLNIEDTEDDLAGRLGTRREFISKHRKSGDHVPWHGYPAQPCPKHLQDFPPDEIIETWRQAGMLRGVTVKRLARGIWWL